MKLTDREFAVLTLQDAVEATQTTCNLREQLEETICYLQEIIDDLDDTDEAPADSAERLADVLDVVAEEIRGLSHYIVMPFTKQTAQGWLAGEREPLTAAALVEIAARALRMGMDGISA